MAGHAINKVNKARTVARRAGLGEKFILERVQTCPTISGMVWHPCPKLTSPLAPKDVIPWGADPKAGPPALCGL